ncbi:hypothetical protein HYZ97_04685 [Candidatus Pacearchaeota archaeon]|nr:hypothetical protein [Candidatus Pacearchaeota archaeon]
MTTAQGVTLRGEERTAYFSKLQTALDVLSHGLVHEQSSFLKEQLREFGAQHKWDVTRFSPLDVTYRLLGKMVEGVAGQYAWLADSFDSEKPEQNRAYFDETTIYHQSGLPWVFDFVELHRLRKNADAELQKLPSYAHAARTLATLLIGDARTPEETAAEATALHRTALKRSFLEQVKNTELYSWESVSGGFVSAQKIMSLGAETLWNVHGVRYIPSAQIFEACSIDVWQDIRGTVIQESGTQGEGSVKPEFINSLKFGVDNAPWFILRDIDERFDALHPVHVSRALIGPFEQRHQNKHTLPIMRHLLAHDLNAHALRFSRQYSYAPNHEVKERVLRQIVHRETWTDEIIVAPGRYASQIAKSIEGTNVRIFEIPEVNT